MVDWGDLLRPNKTVASAGHLCPGGDNPQSLRINIVSHLIYVWLLIQLRPVTNIRFCKNVQHTYVVQTEQPSSSEENLIVPPPSLVTIPDRPPSASAAVANRRRAAEEAAIAQADDYRKRFERSILRNPLYANENFRSSPWELISRWNFILINVPLND